MFWEAILHSGEEGRIRGVPGFIFSWRLADAILSAQFLRSLYPSFLIFQMTEIAAKLENWWEGINERRHLEGVQHTVSNPSWLAPPPTSASPTSPFTASHSVYACTHAHTQSHPSCQDPGSESKFMCDCKGPEKGLGCWPLVVPNKTAGSPTNTEGQGALRAVLPHLSSIWQSCV